MPTVCIRSEESFVWKASSCAAATLCEHNTKQITKQEKKGRKKWIETIGPIVCIKCCTYSTPAHSKNPSRDFILFNHLCASHTITLDAGGSVVKWKGNCLAGDVGAADYGFRWKMRELWILISGLSDCRAAPTHNYCNRYKMRQYQAGSRDKRPVAAATYVIRQHCYDGKSVTFTSGAFTTSENFTIHLNASHQFVASKQEYPLMPLHYALQVFR